jgi:predicted phosphodiesterase
MMQMHKHQNPKMSQVAPLPSLRSKVLYSEKPTDKLMGLSGDYVIFSDIQGNAHALKRFFEATQNMNKKGYICLGDIVNDFSTFDDNQCVDLVRKHTSHAVRGNHEDNVPLPQKVYPENVAYVQSLPESKRIGEVLLFHSSLSHPGKRLRSENELKEECEYIKKKLPDVRYAFFGHTHIHGAYSLDDTFHVHEGYETTLDPDALHLINPGGIGLQYGLTKTFARINVDDGTLRFFTLAQAEKLAEKARIVKAFDDRWMPVLNVDSCAWFHRYAKNDAPFLEQHDDSQIQDVGRALREFDAERVEKLGNSRRKDYFSQYSEELATVCSELAKKVIGIYNVIDPKTSREDYMHIT